MKPDLAHTLNTLAFVAAILGALACGALAFASTNAMERALVKGSIALAVLLTLGRAMVWALHPWSPPARTGEVLLPADQPVLRPATREGSEQ